MNPSEIKKLRTESILKELIPEALANLDDENLKNLCVVDVECKRVDTMLLCILIRCFLMFMSKKKFYPL